MKSKSFTTYKRATYTQRHSIDMKRIYAVEEKLSIIGNKKNIDGN